MTNSGSPPVIELIRSSSAYKRLTLIETLYDWGRRLESRTHGLSDYVLLVDLNYARIRSLAAKSIGTRTSKAAWLKRGSSVPFALVVDLADPRVKATLIDGIPADVFLRSRVADTFYGHSDVFDLLRPYSVPASASIEFLLEDLEYYWSVEIEGHNLRTLYSDCGPTLIAAWYLGFRSLGEEFVINILLEAYPYYFFEVLRLGRRLPGSPTAGRTIDFWMFREDVASILLGSRPDLYLSTEEFEILRDLLLLALPAIHMQDF